jgi:ABC-type transport system involved in multi-copper enzyme maturation permease subunit
MSLGLFLQIAGIGILTTALILGLAMLIFQRRDFT